MASQVANPTVSSAAKEKTTVSTPLSPRLAENPKSPLKKPDNTAEKCPKTAEALSSEKKPSAVRKKAEEPSKVIAEEKKPLVFKKNIEEVENTKPTSIKMAALSRRPLKNRAAASADDQDHLKKARDIAKRIDKVEGAKAPSESSAKPDVKESKLENGSAMPAKTSESKAVRTSVLDRWKEKPTPASMASSAELKVATGAKRTDDSTTKAPLKSPVKPDAKLEKRISEEGVEKHTALENGPASPAKPLESKATRLSTSDKEMSIPSIRGSAVEPEVATVGKRANDPNIEAPLRSPVKPDAKLEKKISEEAVEKQTALENGQASPVELSESKVDRPITLDKTNKTSSGVRSTTRTKTFIEEAKDALKHIKKADGQKIAATKAPPRSPVKSDAKLKEKVGGKEIEKEKQFENGPAKASESKITRPSALDGNDSLKDTSSDEKSTPLMKAPVAKKAVIEANGTLSPVKEPSEVVKTTDEKAPLKKPLTKRKLVPKKKVLPSLDAAEPEPELSPESAMTTPATTPTTRKSLQKTPALTPTKKIG